LPVEQQVSTPVMQAILASLQILIASERVLSPARLFSLGSKELTLKDWALLAHGAMDWAFPLWAAEARLAPPTSAMLKTAAKITFFIVFPFSSQNREAANIALFFKVKKQYVANTDNISQLFCSFPHQIAPSGF